MDTPCVMKIHSDGVSRVRMDGNKQIASTGQGSSVVFYKESLEGDSYQFDIEGDTSIQDMACYHTDNKHFVAVATDDNRVLEYSYSSGNPKDDPFAENQFERLLLRFTAQVNCIDVSADHKHLAAGASDFLVKVVDLTDPSWISTQEGHEAPILSVEFSEHYLASSSCDGTIRVWKFKEKVLIAKVNVFPATNDLSMCSTLCRFSWQPNSGNVLAVPAGEDVHLYKRDTWELINTLTDKQHESVINVCCWSPCGQYLAVGGADGHVTIWKYPVCSVMCRLNTEVEVLSSLLWHLLGPDSAHPLIFSTSTGHLGSLSKSSVYPSEGDACRPSVITDTSSAMATDNDPLVDDSLLMEGIPPDSIFNDEDDLITASITNNVESSNQYKRPASPNGTSLPPSKTRHIMKAVLDSDSELENEDSLTAFTHKSSRSPEPSEVSSTNQLTAKVHPTPPSPGPEYHEIFQPSATPSRLTHRFMVYNIIGMVRCHGDESSTPMIEVEFHSTSTHHSFSVPNHTGWTMAALNDKALVLATEKSEDDPSQFQVMVFSSWDHDKTWTCTMLKDESIDVVAIGDGWVAIATDKQFIRLYSLGGVQREIISCPGQIVTMNGCGGLLGVVYQQTQVSLLSLWLLDIHTGKQATPPHTLPLTNKAKLEWIGFSEQGVPVSYDSEGVVRVLSSRYGGLSWIPVLDCRKALVVKGDHYFVVGMTHDPNLLRVILCKGLDYPPVYPLPVMTTLPVSLPLCDPQTEKSEIENQYLQQLLIHPFRDNPDPSSLLKPLMKMLAIACQSNLEYRGYEIASMITHDQGLELAFQYASKSGHFKLAREISSLKEQRLLDEENQESDLDNYEYESFADGNHSNTNVNGMGINRDVAVSNQRDILDRNTIMKKYSKSGREKILQGRSKLSDSNDYGSKTDEKKHDSSLLGDEMEDEEIEGSGLEDDGDNIQEEMVGEETVVEEELQENTDANASSMSLFSSPQPSATNKTNPFKLATPVSKQIQVNRRSSFLDKLCKTVEEEKEEQRKKKEKINKAEVAGIKRRSTSSLKAKKNKKGTTENSKLSSFIYKNE